MAHTGATTTPDTAASTTFLVELEHTWALFRLYGGEHPAFTRRSEAAASILAGPVRVGINPKGFTADTEALIHDDLQPLARRLVTMGIVGLTIEPGLSPADVRELVQALHESERGHTNAQLVSARVSKATGGRVNALAVRTDDLRYVRGSSGQISEEDAAATWRELFVRACGCGTQEGGTAGPGGPVEAAKWFEAEVRGIHSPDHWGAMLDVWVRELASIKPTDPADPNLTDVGAHDETGPAERPTAAEPRLDAVALFLRSLNPNLRQRLVAGTMGHRRAPEQVVLAVAERLPMSVVLDAFAMLDRTTGEPSPAALALLRKMYHHLTGSRLSTDPPPRSNAELAEVSASLEKLLESNEERKFVPEEYLRRREELSRQSVPRVLDLIKPPDEAQTGRRVADISLQLLAAPEAAPEHLIAALEFVNERIRDWLKSGQFELAARAVGHARDLHTRKEKPVSQAAEDVLAAGYDVAALQEGFSRATGAGAIEGMIQLLQYADGGTLGTLLGSSSFTTGAGGENILLEAVRGLLVRGNDQGVASLFRAARDRAPKAVLVVLATIPEADAIRTVRAILPEASGLARRDVVQTVFNRNFSWPLELTSALLEDEDRTIRRLAMMRLVRDGDPSVSAKFLEEASKPGRLPVDVALGLAELLRSQRQHPAVRAAYKKWMWSGRRWGTFLFVSVGGTGRRAA